MCVALIATSCAPNAYNAGIPEPTRSYDVSSFNGDWQLVTRRSDNGRDWLDERTRFGVDWGTTDGTTDWVRYGAWFLPDAFRIDGTRQMMRIEDEGGSLIAEIPMDSDYRYGSYSDRSYNSPGVRARWISNRRFEVERQGRNGRRIVQTFTLDDRGRQLVVATQIVRDGGTRSYTRVYDRA